MKRETNTWKQCLIPGDVNSYFFACPAPRAGGVGQSVFFLDSTVGNAFIRQTSQGPGTILAFRPCSRGEAGGAGETGGVASEGDAEISGDGERQALPGSSKHIEVDCG